MVFDLLTIFPNILDSYLEYGIIKQALKKGLIKINFHSLREKDKNTDDRPFGGGPGMVVKARPIIGALKEIKKYQNKKIILTSPKGKKFSPADYPSLDQLIIICGRYEGVDERVKKYIDEEISIGDYILSGGELPAMIMIEAITRLLPGVLGNEESIKDPGYPQYTQPQDLDGDKVPEVLLSGHHQKIQDWREKNKS